MPVEMYLLCVAELSLRRKPDTPSPFIAGMEPVGTGNQAVNVALVLPYILYLKVAQFLILINSF